MNSRYGIVVLLLSGLLTAGCGGAGESTEPAETEARKPVRRATAWINPKSGSEVGGSAIFINETSRISLQITIENAPPGELAVHIHETGDCSAEDATSAGGHWNPTHQAHGKWGQGEFHLGDIGNIKVNKDGEGSLSGTFEKWSMGTGEPNDIMGKAVIVHEKADDFATQPTGAAGSRIACGVIREG